jgi:hypothetical protein
MEKNRHAARAGLLLLCKPSPIPHLLRLPPPPPTHTQVHARNKAVDPNINWLEVSRSMAGFTGADCMGIMARAARMAARGGREAIAEDDIYAAMENKAMEAFQVGAGGVFWVPQGGGGRGAGGCLARVKYNE